MKLAPRTQAQNPVMLLVYISAILTTGLWLASLFGLKDASSGFTLAIAIILWFTVLFANFAEAIAEGRGKAQADALRASKRDVDVYKIPSIGQKEEVTVISSAALKKDDLVIVRANEQIPADGEVVEGAASVDESAIIGESAPVIRESGGGRSAVTGGTTVLSDWIVVEVTSEAGVDDFLAEATPEGKLKMIRDFQAKGHLVAMTGDGTNDAPALAQADVAVAMNSGTQAAKEAGNMVDLDSSPTKLIEIVRIGKQLLMTRGSLTTFSIANDVEKYFAIIPALFMGLYPGLSTLNIMNLHSPQSAVLSAIIYNAALIPLALKGVKYREVSAGKLLNRDILFYQVQQEAKKLIFL